VPADRFTLRRIDRLEADFRKLAQEVHRMRTDDEVAARVAAELRKAETRGWTRKERWGYWLTIGLLVLSTAAQWAVVGR
jgi:hypothetical protein